MEHFAPKKKHPDHAYIWENYRLVCTVMNSRKRDFENVLDPFEVEDGWFQIQFNSSTASIASFCIPSGTGRTTVTGWRETARDFPAIMT